jgi:hypothetical protein
VDRLNIQSRPHYIKFLWLQIADDNQSGGGGGDGGGKHGQRAGTETRRPLLTTTALTRDRNLGKTVGRHPLQGAGRGCDGIGSGRVLDVARFEPDGGLQASFIAELPPGSEDLIVIPMAYCTRHGLLSGQPLTI